MTREGFVALVGAGPGSADLITVKGLRRLQSADVVVFDALVLPELLAEARSDAELIPAGKRGGQHSASQDWINATLIEHAQQGKLVVRLKGGDPFVFGRGGEEAAALSAAGIAWEVVPGISSAIAAPAYAGIPVTHRDVASSVVFVTGHEDPTKPTSRINWQALAQGVDTLVFLMGITRINHTVASLIANGRPADTPTAVIRWGTTAEQKTVVAPLDQIEATVKAAGIGAPAILIVGEVVALREQLNWFESTVLEMPEVVRAFA